MNWLTSIVRPKIRAMVGKNAVADNLWQVCPSCQQMVFHRDLKNNLEVCHYCSHHFRIGGLKRLDMLFDDSKYTRFELPQTKSDPLNFKDKIRYVDRLKKAYKANPSQAEAIVVGQGNIKEKKSVIAAFDFHFMGGSMGVAVGQALLLAAKEAIATHSPLIIVSASGGARMQEGIMSLVQMPRTIIAINRVKEKGLPYISVITDPTTGGVSASFAMLGDIIIAEPYSIIGFAGARVIEETTRQRPPQNFQRAESVIEQGFIDMIVHRSQLKDTIASILSLLSHNKKTFKQAIL